ncbi:MAG: hypothetical protein Q4G13_05670 [Moraxella sp.]|nr:hypothetical protein [Moraxella sp.]
MNDFGTPTIIETRPPPETNLSVGNDELSENVRQTKFDEVRIDLFKKAVYGALAAFVILVLLLIVVVKKYLCLIEYSANTIPDNFWHIPLLVAFMASTILSVILTLTARFGDKSKHDDKNGISLSADQSTIKELLQKLLNKF